jgi:hypothetical protein
LRVKHPKYLPYGFTDQGMAMLSSILKTVQAIAINIQIIRVFVKKKADDADRIRLNVKDQKRATPDKKK